MTISRHQKLPESEENVRVDRRSLLLKMELRSNPETLCVVRGALGQLAERLGFSESECRAVVLGVDEALTNIIRHAYAGQPEQPIEVWFHRIQVPSRGAGIEALEIILLDQGKKLDEAKLSGRALEDVRPGGLGLHFIRETMDEVEFSHTDGRNQLRLVKILPAQRPAGS
jgi:serine/threonine-protein kinase RsbW